VLIDEVDITLKAGHGGRGIVSFDMVGPDGGNGGRGGDVFVNVTSDLKALNQFSGKKEAAAEDGQPGAKKHSHGQKGKDLTLILPVGSSLNDLETGEVVELETVGQTLLICKGGLGGRGNLEFKSSKNRSPDYAQPGLPGQIKNLKIILRFIADYGLVGLPNAGKSSLLNELTNAKATVGAYPFTTLEANLGAFGQKIIADIPGLIEGASSGKGLGTKFLKHIEKVKILLHCISSESSDVISDYHTITSELQTFSSELVTKDRIILLTKSDLVDQTILNEQISKLSVFGHVIYPVSIYNFESVEKIKKILSAREDPVAGN